MTSKHMMITASLIFALAGGPATAGPEKVAFPIYQTHVLYDVLDKVEDKEVMEFYINADAFKQVRPGQPLPNGTVLSRPTFKAVLDDKGEPAKDANGRFIRGRLDRVVVMEKRAGWGTEYPTELRNGEWEYGRFGPEGKLTTTANYTACFQCHKPKSSDDFVFTLSNLLKAAVR